MSVLDKLVGAPGFDKVRGIWAPLPDSYPESPMVLVAFTLAVTESKSSSKNGEALKTDTGTKQDVEEVIPQFILSILNAEESSC